MAPLFQDSAEPPDKDPMQSLRHIVPLSVLVCGIPSFVSAQSFDARNTAMGGAGVASSKYSIAAIANPALLTRFGDSDTYSIIVPGFGVSLADKDGLVDAIEDFQDTLEDVQNRLNLATATPADLLNLSNQLLALNGKTATINAGVTFAVAMPSKSVAWSVFAHTYLDAQVFPVIDVADTAQILTAVASGDLDNLGTQGVVLGAAVTEVGVSFAREFSLAGMALSIGVTPKAQRIDTYNYSLNINNFDEGDYNDSQYRNHDTRFNVDVGVAFSPIPPVTVGLMARNLISDEIPTVVTNGLSFTYNLDPSLTVGAAWTGLGLTVAADIDVTELERFKRNDSSRIFRAGVEFDAWSWAQVRGGIQHDLEDTVANIYSAGIGLSPGNLVHIDLTGLSDFDKSVGAAVQMSFTF